ncbi:UGGT1 [Cordylochernes scorpioides]|uniref:UGGT1 n=1 Tax=Cordylochernes scorpioides TaxID=51811 RepID=A0ABY6LHH8_9ARAC|nr:UGGT1 [Cordylochernes scorpioides]
MWWCRGLPEADGAPSKEDLLAEAPFQQVRLSMDGVYPGGILAHSLAIASDAAHMLVDLAGFMISLFSIWMATRPATSAMTFGWYRAEVLGAMASVLLIWAVTLSLDYLAVVRILRGEYDIDSQLMVVIAVVGLAVNVVMALVLHAEPPDAHHATDNINIRAALVHVLGDFLQSVGVLVAAVVIYFWVDSGDVQPDLGVVDPLLTFVFSTIVLVSTYRIIKEALVVLMEGTPKNINFEEVDQILSNIPGVQKVHNLRIWSLSLEKSALSAHLTIAPDERPEEVLRTALRELRSRLDMYEVTLQVEDAGEEAGDRCSLCKCGVESVD